MNTCIYFCLLPDNEKRQINVMENIRKLYSEKNFRAMDIKIFWSCMVKDEIKDEKKYLSEEMLEKEQVKQYPNKKYCAISHAKIWQEILDSGYDYGVIIEDDAMVKDNFIINVLNILSEINDFDFCFLYHHPHFERKNSDEYKYVVKGYGIYGNICYLISKRGIKKLLNSLPFTDNKDVHIQKLIDRKKLKSFISKQDMVTNMGAVDSEDKNSKLDSTIFT